MGLIEETKAYVKTEFGKTSTKELPYHNWKHTENVFNAAMLIAENEKLELNEDQKQNLQIAALFHDLGYIESPKDHEEVSAKMAEEFLANKEVSESNLQEIKRLILATKLGHHPTDELEKIIMDADLSHLGREDYLETTYKYLGDEVSKMWKPDMSDKDWAESCFSFINTHKYLTAFARKKFGSVKKKNLEGVKELMEEKIKNEVATKPTADKEKKGKLKKVDNPLKGAETMYKTALRNHLDLSAIADRKANTLISVNAIIISIVLSALFPKLDSNPYLFLPSVIILVSCLLTMILAILSTIPNVTKGRVSKSQVENKEGNLIFFGNFFNMKLEEYEWSMQQLMNDKDYLYNTLSRDLFFLGKVLGKKYRILRTSYFVFVIGIILSILVFIIKAMPYIGTNV